MDEKVKQELLEKLWDAVGVFSPDDAEGSVSVGQLILLVSSHVSALTVWRQSAFEDPDDDRFREVREHGVEAICDTIDRLVSILDQRLGETRR